MHVIRRITFFMQPILRLTDQKPHAGGLALQADACDADHRPKNGLHARGAHHWLRTGTICLPGHVPACLFEHPVSRQRSAYA